MIGAALSPIPSQHEGKWIAITPEDGNVAAAADTLAALIRNIGDRNVIIHRVLPRDIGLALAAV